MERFEFATAGRIVFGAGESWRLGEYVAAYGTRAFLVTGATPLRVAELMEFLSTRVRIAGEGNVRGEPTVARVQELAKQARRARCDVVVAVGGGSVIDAGKAVACLVTNRGDIFDYLEVIGKGTPLAQPGVPCVALPTTAGTGAEVTRNAVLRSEEHRVKVSLRSPHILPRLALVDPALTYTTPPELTANAGLDALTQLIEAFVSCKANPLTDAICRAGIARARSLPTAVADGRNAAARTDMALASLFSGLALANAKLGAVHGFAGPLGGRLGIAHGAVCARLLPFVTEANLAHAHGSPGTLARYAELAAILTGSAQARATDCIAWLRDLCRDLDVQPLPGGISADEVDELVAQAGRSSSMKGNPVELPDEVLRDILHRATAPGW